jgi:tRNA dimethylallyltransferase
MFAAGLVGEVEALLSRGYGPEHKSMGAIGYREVCDYLAGKMSRDETVEQVKRNTRHYAKRQLTWFRRDGEIYWVEYPEAFAMILKSVSDYLARRSR